MNQNKFQTITNNLKAISNPQSLIKSMANNPQLQAVINKYGNPKTAFYEIAKQQGINPNDILNMFK